MVRGHWEQRPFEHHAFTQGDGVTSPDDGLVILLTPGNSGEAAPMLNKLGSNPLTYTQMAAYVSTLVFGGALPQTIAINPIALFLNAFSPDIVYNHGGEGNPASDASKCSWYHEFSHASHFEGVTHSYWLNNISYVIDNNGYGDGTATGAGRCAVIESWGFHYGPVCADYQYELLHSNGGSTPQDIESFRHIFLLEGLLLPFHQTQPTHGYLKECIWIVLTTML